MAQIWLRRLIEYKRKYNQVMQGRYATFDSLNRVLLILALFFRLFQFLLPFSIGYFLFWGLLGLIVFRLLSKKIYVRINENRKFIEKSNQMKLWFSQLRKPKNSKKVMEYTFFSCPTCHQKQRTPRGKGRIRVTCKKCGTQFETKV